MTPTDSTTDTPVRDPEAAMASVHARLMRREGIRAPQPTAAPLDPATASRFAELRRSEAYNHHQYGAFGREVTVKRGGWKGKVEFFAKRVVRKLLGWYVRPQIEFNASLTRAVAESVKHFEAMAAELAVLRAENQALQQTITELKHPDHGIDYYAFEGRFRGSRDAIKDAQRQYVHLYAGRRPVLDVGCGRGEFLELLREADVEAYGVDLDAGMVEASRERGLAAEQGDAFVHLAGLPDGSLGGLYLAQVVEHMPPGAIARLFALAAAKLQPGAVLVAETPNTICEPAMRNFYLDPTHIRPVHPLLLRFIGEEAGLAFDHFVFTSPMPGHGPASRAIGDELDREDVSQYRDYAVVLRKV
ncbi:putative S-adenosylmethionine-dependent methyltransferase [compost metagenome]